jgi:tetratricopeptide (TPR) repeat protein
MKQKYFTTKRIAFFGILAIVLVSGILYAYSGNKSISADDEAVAVKGGYSVPQLLDRDKDLSYEEFLKIKDKYQNLASKYEADQSDAESLLKLAEIFIFEARVTGEHPYYYNAALTTLDHALTLGSELTPDQKFHALFYKSTVQLSQHKFNEALVTGKQALALNSVNSGIYGVLVDANVEIGNYAEAVSYCDKMIAIRPDLRSYSRISYVRELYGDLKGSAASMKLAINAGEPYSEYKCWTIVTLGKLYEDHNMPDSAASCYNFALNERPNYPFAVAGLASLEAKKGNFAKADGLYAQALKTLPEISFTIARARIMKQTGKTAGLNETIAEIEKMFREDIASGHNMNLEYAAFLNEFKGDHDEALRLGLDELRKRPNNIDVNKLLAFTYYAKGDMENAAKHADIAMKTGKQDADLFCIAGLAKNDKALVKKSFAIDKDQDHQYVARARQLAG